MLRDDVSEQLKNLNKDKLEKKHFEYMWNKLSDEKKHEIIFNLKLKQVYEIK